MGKPTSSRFTAHLHCPLSAALMLTLCSQSAMPQTGQDYVRGNLIQFNDNGFWCWFQDERAVVDSATGRVILGSDASGSGVGGSSRDGNIDAVIFDLTTRTPQRYLLADMSCDDHNAPGFVIRPDGRYLAMYSAHYDYYKNRYRIFDGTRWSPERAYDWTKRPGGTDYTIAYNNVYYLAAENRLYDFTRANHRTPNFLISADWGNTWSWGGQLTTNSSSSYNKGYYKYWGNGVDRIDFIFTEQHPRDTLTSIYHGYIKGGQAYNSAGILVDADIYDTSFIPTFQNFSKVFANGTIIGPDTLRRCWSADLVRYADGTIAAIITARTTDGLVGGYSTDPTINPQHAFVYCRYDGTSWSYTYLGLAGYKFYSSEADYVGLGALSLNHPDVLYISTHFDPRDNASLNKRELFKGTTTDQGKSWNWTPITWNSTRDNIRPIIPAWDEQHELLLWCRGSYTSAQSFDAAVVGIISTDSVSSELLTYVDANLDNTTLSDGSPLSPTGPDANQGPADNRWHLRTGYGNEGSVFTAAELGGENAPLLKTNLTVPAPGVYDVWVNFWANPAYDWRIKAGLRPDRLQIFRHMACKQVEAEAHTSPLIRTGGNNTYLYQAYVGRVPVNESTTFAVFIDDEAVATGSTSLTGNTVRTWYDGVSYRSVQTAEKVPVLVLANKQLDFGTVPLDSTSTDSLPITNGGDALLQITSLFSSNPHFTVEPATLTLAPLQTTYCYITFTPQDTSRQTGLIIIQHNAAGSPDTIWVTGRGEQPTSIATGETNLLTSFTLSQNYPNPFNATTLVNFTIPRKEPVTLQIFDLNGRAIDELVNAVLEPGNYTLSWNADPYPSGVYFYRLNCGRHSLTKKMLLLK